MNFFKYLLPFMALFLLTGCGTKRQSFEPKLVEKEINYSGNIPSEIIDVTVSGATLDNGQIITKNGLENIKLPKGYILLNNSEDKYLASSNDGKLIILDKESLTLYEKKFDYIVASATLKDNSLAVVLADNSVELIDISTNNQLFKQKGDKAYAHDSKIASPHFLDTLLIYPTLDGKLLIVDIKSKKLLRDIVVFSEKYFSNVIFLDVVDDRLIAATKKRIVSISSNNSSLLDEDIKRVMIVKDGVIVLTKDGKIVLTDSSLKIKKSKKFKFASFVGTVKNESIYIVERGGYLIKTDLNLDLSKVYKLPDSIDSHLFLTNDKLYYEDNFIEFGK